jgi:hypothetical protein
MTRGIPVDVLERQAEYQRISLENRVGELRQTVKEQLDVKRKVREHLWPAVGALAVVGVILGYAGAGIFTRD